MSISNLIMGPLVGAIYDKTHQTKLLVLFLNLFEIGGLFAVHFDTIDIQFGWVYFVIGNSSKN